MNSMDKKLVNLDQSGLFCEFNDDNTREKYKRKLGEVFYRKNIKIICDEVINSPKVIDNNLIVAQIVEQIDKKFLVFFAIYNGKELKFSTKHPDE